MDTRKKAEEIFEVIVKIKSTLLQIPLELSQGELGTLLYLSFVEDGVSASVLAKFLDVSLPRVMSIIHTLETKGYVNKQIDQKDKRKTKIYITSDGKKYILEKKECAINKIANIIELLGEKETNKYLEVAKKVQEILKNEE